MWECLDQEEKGEIEDWAAVRKGLRGKGGDFVVSLLPAL